MIYSRKDAASYLEGERDWMLRSIAKHPLEINLPLVDGDVRVVLDKTEDFDVFLEQLRADSVGKEEALNPSLVR